MINRKELIKKYLKFFESKGHKIIANSSLIPENDPTVLFTTAGMHPLVPFLLGQKHPLGKRLTGVQRCIRTGDIDEVGDESHHTFFEMLGNWSLGDYFKEDAIKWSLEFLTQKLKISKEKINVTCFEGDKDAPKDAEAAKIWKSLGINKIKFLNKKENWWGPAGETGPCGPDSEIFVNGFEIWNNVFMEYNCTKQGFKPLDQKNVDTGMGVERTVSILTGVNDDYLTDTFKPIINKIEKISKKRYGKDKDDTRVMRIIADHIKAAVLIIGDGVTPSNTERGYVLRRLIRRAIRYGKLLMMQNSFTKQVAEPVFDIYDDYPQLKNNKKRILEELEKEENKFRQTLAAGLKYFKKVTAGKKKLSGKDSFLLFQSYGFPLEITKELAKEHKISVDEKEFQKEFQKHQELSRTASAGRFKSGLSDKSEETTKLHTAAHLLLQALKTVLKDKNIHQKGSNITPERLRLDFSFPRKLEKSELEEVEKLVNEKIRAKIPVIREEMPPQKAKREGAAGDFERKYGDVVSVYSIGDFSKEICAGPHVKNTSELGKFKIKKEESSSSGVRRIKAILL